MSTVPIFVRAVQGFRPSGHRRKGPKASGKQQFLNEFGNLQASGQVERVEDDPRLPYGVLIHVKLNPELPASEALKTTKLPIGVPEEVVEKLLSIPDVEDFAVVTPVELDVEKIAAALAERAKALLAQPRDPAYDSYKLDLRGNRRQLQGQKGLDFQAAAAKSQESLAESTQLPLCRKKNQADAIKNLEFKLELQKKSTSQVSKKKKGDQLPKKRPIYYHPAVFAVDCGSEQAWISDNTTITTGAAVARSKQRKQRQKEHNAQERTVYMSSIGELYLKKGNQARMVAELMSNASAKLENLVTKVYRNGYYIVYEPAEEATVDGKLLHRREVQEEIEKRLACVPGIDRLSRCLSIPTTFKTIVDRSVENLMRVYRETGFADQGNRFGVQIRMFGRPPITQDENQIRSAIVGKFIQEVREQFSTAPGFQAPQHDSSRKLEGVSLRLSGDVTFLRQGEQIHGVGGQAGAQGRYTRNVVALLSGGFDSPVASWLMMKRGLRVHLIHFQNVNTLSQDAVKNKIVELTRVLSRYQVTTDLYIVPFTEMQARIIESVPASSRMVVYRRFMMKIAGAYAKRTKSDFVVLGDSINQVASQTPDNLAAMYRLSEYPVLSPLIGLDKEEIMDYAKQIGTYDVSALPYGDCCSYFLAKHPMLECKVDQLKDWESAVQDSGVMGRTIRYAQQIRFSGWEKMKIRNEGRLDHYSEEGNPDEDPEACPWERKTSADAMETEDMEVDDAAIANARREAEQESKDMEMEMDAEPAEAEEEISVGRKRPSEESLANGVSGTQETSAAQRPLRKRPRITDSAPLAPQDITETAYFDNAATTAVLSGVLRDMLPFFASPIALPGLLGAGKDLSPFLRTILRKQGDWFANPHSTHGLGTRTQKVVAACREILARSLSPPEGPAVEAKTIYFTSGGTEGNNMAIQGVARFQRRAQPHQALNIVTTALEHDSVLKTCQALLPDLKIQVKLVKVDAEGRVSLEDLRKTVDRHTILVTIMHGNNEIGTLQPLPEIHRICQDKGVLFHTDACQSYTKAPLLAQNADIVTMNAHKIHGPKGVGAVYISEAARSRMDPFMVGGGQEANVRSGTLNVPGIVGLASAVSHSEALAEGAVLGAGPGIQRMQVLRNQLWEGIQEVFPDAVLNGPSLDAAPAERLCNNLSLYLPGSKLEGEAIVLALSRRGVFCSTGSACSSNEENKASHVLTAIGRPYKHAVRSLRFSVSLTSTEEHVQEAVEALRGIKDLISKN